MLVVLIVVVAILLVFSYFSIGGLHLFVVMSGSMEPAIHTGSVVVVKLASSYAVGDVITFGPITPTQLPTTHRIVAERAQEGVMIFKTKGDANNSADPTETPETQIIGKVYFSAPYVGYAVEEAKRPIGFALIIIVPIAVIILDELRKIWKEIRNMKTTT